MKMKALTLFLSILLLCTSCDSSAVEEDTKIITDTDGSTTCRQSYTILGPPDEFIDSDSLHGVKLAVRRWLPSSSEDDRNEPTIKAVIVFQHGGAGFHSGFSDIMGNSMKEAGIAVIAYDIVGSGHSQGVAINNNGNTTMLRNYFPNMATLTNDLSAMLVKAREEYPSLKVFAMGESFGGFVLAAQILEEQQGKNVDHGGNPILADGYIFTGPVIKLLPEMLPPKPIIKILNFVAKFFPMLRMPSTDFFSTFDLAFGDKGWANAGRNDPFVQEAAAIPPRLGMVASVLTTMDKLNKDLEQIRVPFKIFMGEKEGRVDVDAVHRFANVASSKDKSIEIVDGAYHQLFQDLPEVTGLVCKHIQEWVLERV